MASTHAIRRLQHTTATAVRVQAASRLHFGMLSLGAGEDATAMRRFGGAGAMIARPGIELSVSPAPRFQVTGPLVARVRQFAKRYLSTVSDADASALRCRIAVHSAPTDHVGLGTGSQLGMAVAAALEAYSGRPPQSPRRLAAAVGRGQRSAIGVHGFFAGGLLVECGKAPGESLAPLVDRVELPAEWRFVLMCPRGRKGLHGASEKRAFTRLPPIPRATTIGLCDELYYELLPAARAGDFARFSASVYRYGVTAGKCFAAGQGGAFASADLARRVEQVRSLGVAGVGQSSWGPTLFALVASAAEAERLLAELRQLPDAAAWDLNVTSVANRPARISVEPFDLRRAR